MVRPLVVNKKKLEESKLAMAADGAGRLHILSDFDGTLTWQGRSKKASRSLIAVLRDNDFLTADYPAQAHALFDKYHPMEIDPDLPADKKKKAMLNWWSAHYRLLIKCGLRQDDVEKAVQMHRVSFRSGAIAFFRLLEKQSVPTVVMSASALGGDAIRLFLEMKKMSHENIHIVSNVILWDKQGRAVGVQKPIIHCMNKDETVIHNFPSVFKQVKDRKNVILLGDLPQDTDMIHGFKYDNLIKIGFADKNSNDDFAGFERDYDVILPRDASMEYITALVKEIIRK